MNSGWPAQVNLNTSHFCIATKDFKRALDSLVACIDHIHTHTCQRIHCSQPQQIWVRQDPDYCLVQSLWYDYMFDLCKKKN